MEIFVSLNQNARTFLASDLEPGPDQVWKVPSARRKEALATGRQYSIHPPLSSRKYSACVQSTGNVVF